MKKTTVDMTGPAIKVSVQDGPVTLDQTIDMGAIRDVSKEFGVPEDAATKFLIVMTGATLRNVGDEAAAMADMMIQVTEALKADEVWAMAYVESFAGLFLPEIAKQVKAAQAAGQDAVTAVSIASGMPMEGAKALVACVGLLDAGLTKQQIAEFFIAGVKGEDGAEIVKRLGLEKS